MVSITKKRVKGTDYYYLSYSYRESGKVKLIEKAIGREIPSDLSKIQEELIYDIFSKLWLTRIEKIKQKYKSTLKKIPNPLKEKNLRDFGIRFTYNTNKIEGSSLTLRETALVIDEKEVPINKPTNDINEAQCHYLCYEEMIKTDTELSMDLIINWHKKLFSFHPNQESLAGLIRKDQIFISGSDFVPPPPKKVKGLLDKLFFWYNNKKNYLNPVLLACLMKFRFVSIHPFLDGNGRMSRLLMNYILYKNNYPMFNISADIRKTYYRALEKAQIEYSLKGDEMPFIGWFFKNYIKESKKNM